MPLNDALPRHRGRPGHLHGAHRRRGLAASNRQPNCPWHNGTSCSDGACSDPAALVTLLALADSRLPTGGARALRRRRGGVTSGHGDRPGHAGGVSAPPDPHPRPGDGVDRGRGAPGRLSPRRRRSRNRRPHTVSRGPRRHRAARAAGWLRLAARVWPDGDWDDLGPRPHLAVAAGRVGGAQRSGPRAHRAARSSTPR